MTTSNLPLEGHEDLTVIPLRLSGKAGLVNSRGDVVVPFEYDAIWDAGEGMFWFLEAAKYGLLNKEGTVVVPAIFDTSTECGSRYHPSPDFSEGLAPVSQGGKCGFINRSGTWVISPKWFYSWEFSGGYALVESEHGYFVINKVGEVVSKLPVYDIKQWSPGPLNWDYVKCLSLPEDGWRMCFCNRLGEIVFPPLYDELTEMFSGVVGYCPDTDGDVYPYVYGLVGADQRIIKPPQFHGLSNFDPVTGFAMAGSTAESIGFIDVAGEWAIEPRFTRANPFTEGLACVETSFPAGKLTLKRYGYIDTAGQWVIEPEFKWALPFSEGLAGVQIEKKKGFIDRHRNVIIEPRFQSCESFRKGLAIAKLGDETFVLNKRGDVVWHG